MINNSILLVASLLIFYVMPVKAADFVVECVAINGPKKSNCAVFLSGEIIPGDANKMRSAIKKVTKKGQVIETLILNSNGGDVIEATKISKLVRALMLETSTVYSPTQEQFNRGIRGQYACVSACFIVWASGARRTTKTEYLNALGHSGIGLHRPYFVAHKYDAPPGQVADAQADIISIVRTGLQSDNIPLDIIEKMMSRSSREVYWLSEIDEGSISEISPWLEEMLIARCQFDPEYNREMERRNVEAFLGKLFNKDDGNVDPVLRHWEEWNEGQKNCENKIRSQIQSAL